MQSAKEKKIQVEMRKAESHNGLKVGDLVKVSSNGGNQSGKVFKIESFSELKKDRDFIGATFARGQGMKPHIIHHEVGDLKKVDPKHFPKEVQFIKEHIKERK